MERQRYRGFAFRPKRGRKRPRIRRLFPERLAILSARRFVVSPDKGDLGFN